MSRMFSFITTTWNPLGGSCPHECIYCWSMGSKGLVKRYDMKKYQGPCRLIRKELSRTFSSGDFVFVQDMSDLFSQKVPSGFIHSVMNRIERLPSVKFLLLTKNPSRYLDLITSIPENCILGATVETNGWTEERGLFYREISRAPLPIERITALIKLRCWMVPHEIMVSIEPILDFDHDVFLGTLKAINPSFVAVGYDNYGHRLPEPSLEKTLRLIQELEKFTTVYRKTIRKAWWEE